MGTSNLKSVGITNLDALPALQNTAGENGPGILKNISGYVTAVAADAAGSTYRLVRVPSTTKVKSIWFESEAQGAGAVNLGVYYSDATNDGTAVANQGAIVNSKSALFASDIDCTSYVAKDVTNESGSFTFDLRDVPLWKACGLTADPGGKFDIVATVHTTAITTGTGRVGVSVNYLE